MTASEVSRTQGVEDELFSRQVLAAMRVASRANLANAASIVMLALYVALPAHTVIALGWMALALLAAAPRVVVWGWGQRASPETLRPALVRRYYRITLIEVLVQGVLNTALVGYLLPRIDPGRQAVLVATFAGILGAGTVALSTVRSVGVVWVVIHVLGAVPIFLSMDRAAFDVLTGQLLVYGAFLVVGGVYLANSFQRRSVAEIRALHAQQFVELLLDDFEDGSRDWLWETGADGTLTHVSERLADVSGCAVEELRELRFVDLLRRLAHPSEEGRRSVEELSDQMDRAVGIRDHLVHVQVGGSDRWWTVSAKPRKHADGLVVGWRGVGADTTQAHLHAEEMLRLAQTDPLTGLANRRLFQDRLASVLAADPSAGEVHLAIFDLDNFKAVNDTLGHSVGDELLGLVATRLSSTGSGDFVARLGGDEFAVVSQQPIPPEFPELLFAPYQEAFVEPFTVRGNRLTVGASVGCARAWPRSATAEDLVGMADLALYDAKAVSPGRLSSFTAVMSLRARQRAALLADLELAIDREEFLFHFQPQHDLLTGRVVATEALLRWQHPTRGLLPPSAFLEVAEESGLLVSIGGLMLREACRKAAGMGGDVRLAFNVSQVELEAKDFLDSLEQSLEEFAVPPGRLELEVTESAAATAHTESILREVRHLGVRIAVDDFGVGYSSLARLQQLPVDVLKVDRIFAGALSSTSRRTSGAALAILKSAVDIASALGIEALAEGIEEPSQLALVRSLGFDLVQGYLVASPAPDVTRHLRLVDPH